MWVRLSFGFWHLGFVAAGVSSALHREGLLGAPVNSIHESVVCYYNPRYVFLMVSSFSSSSAVPWAMMCPLDMT